MAVDSPSPSQTPVVSDRVRLRQVPITEFARQELWELDKYQSDTNTKLTEIEGYGDAKALANCLLDQFKALWTYRITITLPGALAELLRPEETAFDISYSVRVASATEEFIAEFQLETRGKKRNQRLIGGAVLLMGANDKAKWVDRAIYLQISAEEYIGDLAGSTDPQRRRAPSAISLWCGRNNTPILDFKVYRRLQDIAYVYRR